MDNFAGGGRIIHSFIHKPRRTSKFLLQMRVLRVALDVPVAKLFDYLAEDGAPAEVGDRIVVPFGARQRVGVAVEISDDSSVATAKLKPIARVLADAPRLSADWLRRAVHRHHDAGSRNDLL